MKRLFIAIKLTPDENFLRIYYSLRNNLKASLIKWVEPDKLHLTLKFLGETPNERITQIKQILTHFVEDKKEFEIAFDKVGIFGSSYNPRVIWFGLNNNHLIKEMGENLLQYFHENGFNRDRQNFVPHLTIGRIKKIENKKYFQTVIDKVKDENIQRFNIKEIVLYQSILKPTGPIYIELGEFELK